MWYMEKIREELAAIIEKVFGVTGVVVELTPAPEGTGADFATNVAMRLAKTVGKVPREVAEDLRRELEASGELVGVEVTVAGPGFLNFRLGLTDLRRQAQEVVSRLGVAEELMGQGSSTSVGMAEGLKATEGVVQDYAGKMVVAEFSDPNPFKVLHVGHLYTSVVGEAISRLLECAGAKVARANFGGDVGLHVGKTLWAVRERGYRPEDLTIERIAECYVEGTRAYEEDEAAKAEIARLNKVIYVIAERGEGDVAGAKAVEGAGAASAGEAELADDGELAQLYWRGRELSYEYFKEFYARIGVKFDKFYPESTVAGRGLKEVREHLGTVYEESDGAVVYRGEKEGLHTRVFINREGVPTYETKDVGLLFTKWDDWKFDESVVITGNEQKDYMRVVLASVREYAPELVERTEHLTHGLVKLAGNVKMSSRKGNFIKAVDVLDGVEELLRREGRGKQAETQNRLVEGQKDQEEWVDPRLVLAAVKYAFLRYKMGGDIIFDPQESVSMTGNSGVYLLYSAVRARKILARVEGEAGVVNKKVIQEEGDRGEKGEKGQLNKKVAQEDLAGAEEFERKLYKKIVQYGEVLSMAVREKAPHKICMYLYELAQEFSRFYEAVPVAGSVREQERVELVRADLAVMQHGLGLLGIEIPEEM